MSEDKAEPQPPLPTQERWQELVAAAIADETLDWVLAYGSTWDLRGSCPNCKHAKFSNVYDFDVYRGQGLREVIQEQETKAPANGLLIACLGEGCGTHHGAEGTSCGAGEGLRIDIPLPPGKGD